MYDHDGASNSVAPNRQVVFTSVLFSLMQVLLWDTREGQSQEMVLHMSV